MWFSSIIRIFILISVFEICSINVNAIEIQCDEHTFPSNSLKFVLRTYRSKLMAVGMPDLKLPSLEPLEIKRILFETRNPEFGVINLDMTNLSVKNLSTFKIDRACLILQDKRIIMNLRIPKVIIDGFYNLSGMKGTKIDLKGSGPMHVEINNLKIYLHKVYNIGETMSLKRFKLDFSMDSVNSNLENLMGSENVNIINQAISESLPSAMEKLKPEILPQIRNFILYKVNNTLSHLSVNDMTKAIHQFAAVL